MSSPVSVGPQALTDRVNQPTFLDIPVELRNVIYDNFSRQRPSAASLHTLDSRQQVYSSRIIGNVLRVCQVQPPPVARSQHKQNNRYPIWTRIYTKSSLLHGLIATAVISRLDKQPDLG
jgi:hypothetical protein